MNNEYAHPNVLHQRNAAEQSAAEDEKRSINALSLFISKFLFKHRICHSSWNIPFFNCLANFLLIQFP